MALSLLFFFFFSAQFDIPYSISHFSKFKIIIARLLSIYYVQWRNQRGGNCPPVLPPCKIVHRSYIFRVFLKAYHINQLTEEKVFDFLYVTVCKLYECRFPAVKEIKIVVVATAALRGVVNVVLLWIYPITDAS